MKQWFYNLGIAFLSFLSPIVPLFASVSLLIATDFIFGVYRAHKLGTLSSRKMGHTISKVLLYNLAVLTVYMIEKYVLQGDVPYSKIIVGVIAMVELKSIDESFKMLFGYSIYEKVKGQIKRGESQTKPINKD
jgi:phage-related holin